MWHRFVPKILNFILGVKWSFLIVFIPMCMYIMKSSFFSARFVINDKLLFSLFYIRVN